MPLWLRLAFRPYCRLPPASVVHNKGYAKLRLAGCFALIADCRLRRQSTIRATPPKCSLWLRLAFRPYCRLPPASVVHNKGYAKLRLDGCFALIADCLLRRQSTIRATPPVCSLWLRLAFRPYCRLPPASVVHNKGYAKLRAEWPPRTPTTTPMCPHFAPSVFLDHGSLRSR